MGAGHFLIGMIFGMLLVYFKRNLLDTKSPDPIPWIAVVLTFPVGLVNLIGNHAVFPPWLIIVAWGVSGIGFALIFLEWPKVFMTSWQKDVGVFLASGGILGGLMFLFVDNLTAPYGEAALLLLPLCSVLIFSFVLSHTASKSVVMDKPIEETRLFPLTGFTVALFGVLLGFPLYIIVKNLYLIQTEAIALAIALGAGLNVVFALLVKHYVPFGTAEKLCLTLSALGFLGIIFFGEASSLFFCLFLLAVLVYFDFANLNALMGFASGHPSPFWRIARGQLVIPSGIAISWVVCMALELNGLTLLDYLPLICIALVLALAILAIFVPFQDNTFANKSIDNAIAEEGFFKKRCNKTAQDYKLSNREREILYYLAKGRNAQFISEELSISAYTAKTHVYHIYQKIGINSQQELITIVDSIDVAFE